MRSKRLLLAAAVCVGLNATSVAWAQSSSLLRSSPKIVALFRDICAKPSEHTVRIKCGGKDVALGTIVTVDGWILTKHSELQGKAVCTLRDGRVFDASLVSMDERHDVALLKIECDGLKPAEWCDSKCCPVGHWVASVGTGLEPVAIGVVSVASRNVPVGKVPPPSKPGGAGGYLGVGLEPDTAGPRISQIMPGAAAEKAGLKVKDLVLTIGGEEVTDVESAIAILQRHKPGDVVALKIKRDDKELELKATLGKRPASANRGDFQNRLGSELSNRYTGFPTILQHDTIIKPTDCGGPLVDLDGKVIGINIARAGRTESYALPAEILATLVSKLMPEKIVAPRRTD